MRSLFLAVVSAAALVSTGAIAADLRVAPRPVVVAPPALSDWTGAFIGVHAGYGWANRQGHYDTTFLGFPVDAADFDYGVDGFLAGGQIGYNYQFKGSPLVLGFEMDGSWADMNGTAINEFDEETADVNIRWLATATAKLGFAVSSNLLLYAKAGVAFGDFDHAGFTGCNFRNTNVGWTAGAGGEVKVTRNVSVKAEYNYLDFGGKTNECTAFGIFNVTTSGEVTAHVAKVGLNLHFK